MRYSATVENMEVKSIRIGLLGCGNVGKALVDLLESQREAILSRTGLDLSIQAIAVRNIEKHTDLVAAAQPITNNPGDVVSSDDVDLVVEVIGGVDPVKELVETALRSGKPVVTANKELLAKH